MKSWMKPSHVEWISFVVMMPVIDLLLNYLLFGERLWWDSAIWLYSGVLVFVQGFCSWYLHVLSMHWLRVKYPQLNQTTLRVAILVPLHISLIFLTFAFLFYGYDYYHFLGYKLNEDNLRLAFYMAIALTAIATTLWESEYSLKKYKESLKEKEQVQQMAIEQEFETLKNQVNPHFLFNCFNTLSSLITEDPAQADVFLNELSKVYRYLLNNIEEKLASLEKELMFIESFFSLLKTRYGSAIELHIDVGARYRHHLIPSLSLQLLVENAVKHNIISKHQPLEIEVFVEGEKLVVKNNLQCKIIKAVSHNIGLKTIKAKYDLLKKPGFSVMDDGNCFKVALPLISLEKEDTGTAIQYKQDKKKFNQVKM